MLLTAPAYKITRAHKMRYSRYIVIAALAQLGCTSQQKTTMVAKNQVVQLLTLDPGHFHAALVQKEMYAGIDSTVHVYAPGGAEVQAYLSLINQYNSRAEQPTHWHEEVYYGRDYLQKMLAEKKGNVVVLAGNNQQKTSYIQKSIDAGLNVLGDKPMAINYENFLQLQQAFKNAVAKKIMLYDIMTERSEITNILQRELAQIPELFGQLQQGSLTDPAVIMESVHFYYKYVSGKVLTRPAWFFDPLQQGDAITDVGTHLIDLVQWECFPEKTIDFTKDVSIEQARIWPEPLSLAQFNLITGQQQFPAYLQKYVTNDTVLQTHGNGQINYTVNGVHTKITARWQYSAPPGSSDTHYSLLKGTKASLEIRQGAEEKYQPTLYILPSTGKLDNSVLQQAIATVNKTYPGVSFVSENGRIKIIIPQQYKVGHEAHFGQVMQRFLQYMKAGILPDWEVPNMLAKYYIATRGLQMAETQTTHH